MSFGGKQYVLGVSCSVGKHICGGDPNVLQSIVYPTMRDACFAATPSLVRLKQSKADVAKKVF